MAPAAVWLSPLPLPSQSFVWLRSLVPPFPPAPPPLFPRHLFLLTATDPVTLHYALSHMITRFDHRSKCSKY